MTKKVKILTFLNLFFIILAAYAVYVFCHSNSTFSADKLISGSLLKEKHFSAEVVEIKTPDAIEAWLMEEHSAPLISISFYFDGAGYEFDENGKVGVSNMVANLLSYGTKEYDYEKYYDLLETNGINISFNSNDETFGISMTTPKQNMDTAKELLKSVLTEPAFKEDDIKLVKAQVLEAIKIQAESPQKVLSQALKKEFYGDHPKARLGLGKSEDVTSLSRYDLMAFKDKHFGKNNLHIAVAGDISKQETIEILNYIFGPLKETVIIETSASVNPAYVFDEKNIERSMPQVISCFLAPGTKRLSPDFYSLYIANEIFGGVGLLSRLNTIAREKEGLTYGAWTYLDSQKEAPHLIGTFSTSKQNYEQMRQILFDEWQRMSEEGVTLAEFEAVKQNMLTSFNLRFKSISDIALMLSYMQKENLGIDFLQKRNTYVENISFEEVNAAAKKYFKNNPSVLTIGNND